LIEPLVVIVPAYNAEPTLAKVVKDVRRNLPGALIIGVDDGSTDGSRKLLRTVADETIEFDENRGKGAALRAGFDAALKKGAAAVLTIDSDGQHDAAFAPAIVGALDRADIVIGTRDLSGKAVPKHRRIANMISSAATRAVSGGKVRDSQSGYRAMKAEVASFRSVDQAGGVVGAHLKENAQLEFTERLAAEKAVRIVEGVAGANRVEAKMRSLADNPVELFSWTG